MIRPFESLMLKTLIGPLVAALQLFAFYVLVHGHYSPGGGFQGGILIAGSLILPLLISGQGAGKLVLSMRGAVSMAAIGVLIFTLIGALAMLGGNAMLDYGVLPLAAEVAYRRSLAILLIEFGVTLAVAGAMVAIFYALAGPIGAPEEEL
jgi:multicomponent Na+:H+ antiporter subunit B